MGLSKRMRIWTAVGVVVAVPFLALAWWLGSPLFIDKVVEEEFPFAQAAQVPDDMTRREVEDAMATIAKVGSETKEAMTTEMAVASVVKSGEFMEVDSVHGGEGTASIYKLPDGSHVLRLQDFGVTNGPDLRVILAVEPEPDGFLSGNYTELGKLKGNIGNQNYPIPENVDPSRFNSVVIYCKPFHVLFSFATLR